MKLPIDVVPSSRPPQFRWQSRVGTPLGLRTVDHEGSLPASVEGAVADLVALARWLVEERDKLQRFKDWVHEYLDGKGVPQAPDGAIDPQAGMDWVFAQLDALRAQQEEADAAAEVAAEGSSGPEAQAPCALHPRPQQSQLRQSGRGRR